MKRFICMAYGQSVFFVRGMWRHGWVQKTCITSPHSLPSTECCYPGQMLPDGLTIVVPRADSEMDKEWEEPFRRK